MTSDIRARKNWSTSKVPSCCHSQSMGVSGATLQQLALLSACAAAGLQASFEATLPIDDFDAAVRGRLIAVDFDPDGSAALNFTDGNGHVFQDLGSSFGFFRLERRAHRAPGGADSGLDSHPALWSRDQQPSPPGRSSTPPSGSRPLSEVAQALGLPEYLVVAAFVAVNNASSPLPCVKVEGSPSSLCLQTRHRQLELWLLAAALHSACSGSSHTGDAGHQLSSTTANTTEAEVARWHLCASLLRGDATPPLGRRPSSWVGISWGALAVVVEEVQIWRKAEVLAGSSPAEAPPAGIVFEREQEIGCTAGVDVVGAGIGTLDVNAGPGDDACTMQLHVLPAAKQTWLPRRPLTLLSPGTSGDARRRGPPVIASCASFSAWAEFPPGFPSLRQRDASAAVMHCCPRSAPEKRLPWLGRHQRLLHGSEKVCAGEGIPERLEAAMAPTAAPAVGDRNGNGDSNSAASAWCRCPAAAPELVAAGSIPLRSLDAAPPELPRAPLAVWLPELRAMLQLLAPRGLHLASNGSSAPPPPPAAWRATAASNLCALLRKRDLLKGQGEASETQAMGESDDAEASRGQAPSVAAERLEEALSFGPLPGAAGGYRPLSELPGSVNLARAPLVSPLLETASRRQAVQPAAVAAHSHASSATLSEPAATLLLERSAMSAFSLLRASESAPPLSAAAPSTLGSGADFGAGPGGGGRPLTWASGLQVSRADLLPPARRDAVASSAGDQVEAPRPAVSRNEDGVAGGPREQVSRRSSQVGGGAASGRSGATAPAVGSLGAPGSRAALPGGGETAVSGPPSASVAGGSAEGSAFEDPGTNAPDAASGGGNGGSNGGGTDSGRGGAEDGGGASGVTPPSGGSPGGLSDAKKGRKPSTPLAAPKDPLQAVQDILDAIMGVIKGILQGILQPLLDPIMAVVQGVAGDVLTAVLMGGAPSPLSKQLDSLKAAALKAALAAQSAAEAAAEQAASKAQAQAQSQVSAFTAQVESQSAAAMASAESAAASTGNLPSFRGEGLVGTADADAASVLGSADSAADRNVADSAATGAPSTAWALSVGRSNEASRTAVEAALHAEGSPLVRGSGGLNAALNAAAATRVASILSAAARTSGRRPRAYAGLGPQVNTMSGVAAGLGASVVDSAASIRADSPAQAWTNAGPPPLFPIIAGRQAPGSLPAADVRPAPALLLQLQFSGVAAEQHMFSGGSDFSELPQALHAPMHRALFRHLSELSRRFRTSRGPPRNVVAQPALLLEGDVSRGDRGSAGAGATAGVADSLLYADRVGDDAGKPGPGGVGSAVSDAATKDMNSQMAASLARNLVPELTVKGTDAIAAEATAVLTQYLVPILARRLANRVSDEVSSRLTSSLAHGLTREIPTALANNLVGNASLLPFASRGIASSVVGALSHTLGATPASLYYGYYCKTAKLFCDFAEEEEVAAGSRRYQAAHYAAYFGQYYTRAALEAMARRLGLQQEADGQLSARQRAPQVFAGDSAGTSHNGHRRG